MFSRATGAPRSLTLLCAIALLLLVVPVRSTAQTAGAEAGPVRTALTGGAEGDPTELNLLVGRSTVVNVGQAIMRVSLTRPEIADVMVTGTQQLLVHGKTPGTISMFVWNHAGAITRYDVTVTRDLTLLDEQLKQLFPGESISVTSNGKSVVVSGTVSSKYIVEKATDVAAGYVDKKDDVVNLLRMQEGVPTTQVLLRVRFAEVSRSALTELGASLFTGAGGYRDYVARSTTEQFAAPNFDPFERQSIQGVDRWGGGRDTVDATGGKQTFSDFLNLFLFNNRYNVGAVIRALQSKGLFESLAEPNLVTEDGKEASFLAGGEYPYPVVQGTGSNLAVTIVFKEFGIRLSFTPTLMGGGLVHLKVKPEVSSLDFGNSVTYQGFRIPALSTRRADTEIELMDGQTFAIAGLLNNTMTSSLQKVPGIGDIPILGLLFRSKSAQKNQTELVVMITPQILRRGSMGAATGLPNLIEPYLEPVKKTFSNPPARLPGGAPQQKDDDAPAPVANARVADVPPAQPAPPAASAPVAQGVSPAKPAAIAQPAPVVAAPVAPTPPAPAAVAPSAPARATVAPAPVAPPPAPPKVDQKKLAEERKAAEKAAERKKEADRKAADQAAKALKERQEEEGRELARQRELDTKRRAHEAKAAEERRKVEAKAADQQHKAELKRAEEQVKAERARLALARKQAEEARKLDENAARERATRDAEVARQVTELQKKQNDAEKKRLKEIQDAVDRLNAAQAAYQAAVEKVKKDGAEK
jgi:pilus assembly protein CpaC